MKRIGYVLFLFTICFNLYAQEWNYHQFNVIIEKREFEQANDLLLKSDWQSDSFVILKAKLEFYKGNSEFALSLFDSLQKVNQESILLKARILIALQQFNYSEFVKQNGDDTIKKSGLYKLIFAMDLFDKANYHSANEYLESISPAVHYAFEYYFLKARVFEKLGQFSNAANQCSMALDYNPYSGECYYLRYSLRREMKLKKEAKYDLEKAYKLNFISRYKYNIKRVFM